MGRFEAQELASTPRQVLGAAFSRTLRTSATLTLRNRVAVFPSRRVNFDYEKRKLRNVGALGGQFSVQFDCHITVELRPEKIMKIAAYTENHTRILGKCCDRCGHRVQLRAPEAPDGRTAVSLCAEMAGFVSVDIDESHQLQRADLCESCASELLDCLRPFLPAFRAIAADDPLKGYRTYSYHLIDRETGCPFQVSSLFDDGA